MKKLNHATRQRRLRVLVAPSGFKEGLDVSEVAEAMARGVLRALPDCLLTVIPVFDGSEGFARALVRLKGGRMRNVTVSGPFGKSVDASFGLINLRGRRTAVIEISAAAGLRLVPPHRRDPMRTSSRGVGDLIRAALDAGARRLLIGCGDSGVNDGGAGMAQALGVCFLDKAGREIGPGGAALADLHRIDTVGLDPRLAQIEIEVCLNIRNMLLGPNGVSLAFGPQKGATPAQARRLDMAMRRYARCLQATSGIDIANLPGAGASGGLGAAFHALMGARLTPRYDFIRRFIPLPRLIAQSDLIISAEGRIDRQTCHGKIPGEIAREAKRHGKPVIVLAGAIGEGAEDCYAAGVTAFMSIIDQPYNLQQAINGTRQLLEAGTESVVRIFAIGRSPEGLKRRRLPDRRASG